MSEMSSQKNQCNSFEEYNRDWKTSKLKSATQRTTLLEIGDFLCTI